MGAGCINKDFWSCDYYTLDPRVRGDDGRWRGDDSPRNVLYDIIFFEADGLGGAARLNLSIFTRPLGSRTPA